MENNMDEDNHLRIVILDNNDSELISKSVSSINSISSKIPISIIKLHNFSQDKIALNNFNKNSTIDNLNKIIENNSEEFILIIESGDLVKKELVDELLPLVG